MPWPATAGRTHFQAAVSERLEIFEECASDLARHPFPLAPVLLSPRSRFRTRADSRGFPVGPSAGGHRVTVFRGLRLQREATSTCRRVGLGEGQRTSVWRS